jgi:hypothetical protein
MNIAILWNVILVVRKQRFYACSLLLACCLLYLLFDPEDGNSTFLLNISELLPDYTELHPRSSRTTYEFFSNEYFRHKF